MKVAVEYIQWLIDERAKINRLDLEELEFYENGMRVEIDEQITKDFIFTGLNNIDFISSGFYKTGFDECHKKEG